MHSSLVRFVSKALRDRLGMPGEARGVIGNIGWLVADKALRVFLGIAVGVWVARYLGPGQFGELSYAIAFVGFFQIIAELGLPAIVIRDIARDRMHAPELLGSAFYLRFLTAFISWGGAVLGIAILRPHDREALLLVAIVAGTIAFQATDVIDLWFQSQVQSKRTVLSKGASYVAASILKIALILTEAPLIAFAVITLLEAAMSAVALIIAYRRYPAPGSWNWSYHRALVLLRESWPFLIAGLAVVLYMRIDQIFLRELVGEEELGIYSAALTLSSAWHFIPVAICSSLAPSFSRLKVESEAAYLDSLRRLFALMWVISLSISVAMALCAEFIVRLLYGDAYREAGTVLAIHVFANVPIFLGVAQSLWITNERRPAFALHRTIVGLLVNVVLNMVLIPMYGAIGAAIATLVAQFSAAVLYNIIAARDIFSLQILCFRKLRL